MSESDALLEEIEELKRRLAESEQTLRALASGEVDAVAHDVGAAPVLLRAAQDKLRDRERLFRAVFDGSLDAMLIANDLGRYVDVNPAACDLFGIPKDDLVGRNVGYFDEMGVDTDDVWARFIREGHMRGLTAMRRPDGDYRDIDFRAAANILPGLHLSVVRDMTRQHQAELRFQALIENITDVIMLSSADCTVLYTSPSIGTVLGYESAELVGQRTLDLVHPDDRRLVADRRQSLLDDPTVPTFVQARARHRNGSWRWVESTARNLLDDPAIKGIVSNFRDITVQKEAVEMQARLAAIVEFSNDAIIAADLGGTITSWNRAAARLLGYSTDEVSGKSISLLMPPDRTDEAKSILRRIARGESVEHFETVRRKKDGALVELSLTISPIRDWADRVVGASEIARDLTERRRSEEALRRTHAQLQQAQKMEAVGRLAGGVAHDFNNVLSVIISYCSFVIDEVGTAQPMLADLETVVRAAERATGLTRQLLAFSRQQVLQPCVLDLNETIARMQKLLRRLLGEDIQLSLHTSRATGKVNADPGQIEQVIMNLAVNARDAMPTGGTLSIETADVELDLAYAAEHIGVTPGQYVMVAVTDTGVGVDSATQAQMFEPFFTTKELGKGTGLGLSTVFGIVQQSGGHIRVFSEPGKGATFKVYLPRTGLLPDSPSTAPSPLASLRGSETVLLVEDDEHVRELACTILRRNGYNVLEAQNGGEAFLTSEQYPGRIDILVTDVVMPRLSGRQLVERLGPIRPEMKVLFMSGYTGDAIIHHGVLGTEFAYLQKPITPDTFLRKMREVIDSPRAARATS